MSGTYYKALGFVVAKGGAWYLRRRLGIGRHNAEDRARRAAAPLGVVVAGVALAAVVLTRRHSASAQDDAQPPVG